MRVFTDRNGLPQNSVEAMTFDAAGRLWVCTRYGAAVYDGRHWTTVDMPGTGSNWPRAVLASSDGSLWFGTESGGVFHRDTLGRWTVHDERTGFPGRSVRALIETRVGGGRSILWAGAEDGLWRLDAGTWRNVADSSLMEGAEVTTLATTPGARSTATLWIGTQERGLFVLEGNSWRARDQRSGLPSNSITALLPVADEDGGIALWIGTEDGLVTADSDLAFRAVEGPERLQKILSLQWSKDTDGVASLWVATRGGGIWQRRGDEWRTLDTSSGLPSDIVFEILPLQRGLGTEIVIAGTLRGLAFVHLDGWITFDEASGLPDQSVVSLLETHAEDGEPQYWFGTAEGGLAQLENGEWTRFDSSSGLPGDGVFALLETLRPDGTRTVWAGSNHGIASYSAGTWHRPVEGLPDYAAVSLLERETRDGRSELWVGTYGGGIGVLTERGWQLYREASGELRDNRVEAMLETRVDPARPEVWVATNRGLARWSGNRWDHFDQQDGLPDAIVRSLHLSVAEGGRRTLWAGTSSGPAWLDLDDATAPWKTLSAPDFRRLPNPVIYRIEEDAAGRIYLCTTRGVARLTAKPDSPEENRFGVETFSTADGLPSNECNFGASMVDSSGRIWVGTVGGAAVFDPLIEEQQAPVTPLRLVGSVRGEHPTKLIAGSELSHNASGVRFDFDLATLFRKDKATFRTFLEGFDRASSGWSPDLHRDLTQLPSGSYRMHVWGRDDAGRVSGPETIAFAVAPAPWNTWWARLLYALAALTLVAAVARFVTAALRRRNLELEALVSSRTWELENSNQRLAEANSALEDASLTDPLTGTRNRRYLESMMESLIPPLSRRHKHRVLTGDATADPSLDLGFFILDLDYFKEVNDERGHVVGDRILLEVSRRLESALREGDVVIRWGGDEFLIVAPGTARTSGPKLVSRFREALTSRPIDGLDGDTYDVSCSVGYAFYPFLPSEPDAIDWTGVIELADLGLLEVKRGGRGRSIGIRADESLTRDEMSEHVPGNLATLFETQSIQKIGEGA